MRSICLASDSPVRILSAPKLLRRRVGTGLPRLFVTTMASQGRAREEARVRSLPAWLVILI